MVQGNQAFAADRTADVLTQVDELRLLLHGLLKTSDSRQSELKALTERVSRMADFLNKQKNGSVREPQHA